MDKRFCWSHGFSLFLLFWGAGRVLGVAQIEGPEEAKAHIEVAKDFIQDFGEGRQRNPFEAEVNRMARTDQVIMQAISLHPQGEADSVLTFPSVPVPVCEPGEQAFLIFFIGLSDGIPWDHPAKPNGVRFSVVVNSEVLFEEDVAEPGWKNRAIPLKRWAGAQAAVEFRTNAIDSNSSYDWALFGQPKLILWRPDALSNLAPDSVGIAMGQVRCDTPGVVTLSMGEVSERVAVRSGTHWIPLHFSRIDEVKFAVEKGSADLVSVQSAPHRYRVVLRELKPGSPLILAGVPFSAYAMVQNLGEGVYPGGAEAVLKAPENLRLEDLGKQAAVGLPVGRLGPGEVKALAWTGLTVPKPGEGVLGCELSGQSELVSFHAFPKEPVTEGEHRGAASSTEGKDLLVATVGNEVSRLRVVAEKNGPGYALADVWNGKGWQRVGSIYPLARVIVCTPSGAREELRVNVRSLEGGRNRLVVRGTATSSSGQPWPFRVTLAPEGHAPRIAIEHELSAPEDGQILAFIGPTVLAGDKAFGEEKEFALFPGLEFLEGAEPSSSDRDLAPPLSDRRVPAAHKITVPLMAVQAQQALVALLWDEKQEWAQGERFPACRFVCPAPGAGMDHIHMSLFAPSVGKYVIENHEEGASPYAMRTGEAIRLQSQLVLDHQSRYDQDSVVRGPHRSGLALQSVRHWIDAFGLPEPSPQPRAWEDQRALSREAYLTSLWSESPPGWPSHTGAAIEPDLELTIPLTLDLAAGVHDRVRLEMERRIQLVMNLSAQEKGDAALWGSNRVFLPFYLGRVPEALSLFKGYAEGLLSSREEGNWVWRPQSREVRTLGVPGTHTLGQAAYPSLMAVRVAACSGDNALLDRSLQAMAQMELYDVPRGASMWECPQLQPDLLAAALAIRAYGEAYGLTGDPKYLDQARYWGWSGLPFVYLWSLDGTPAMLYNTLGVIGSTFYTHSWLGRPVVWMGLDYAYALQDLAQIDDSFPWLRVAQGITNCAMWQQYTKGPSKGLYPDSWELTTNSPNPADLNPLLIQLNEFRLRGQSLPVAYRCFQGGAGRAILSSGAEILSWSGGGRSDRFSFKLRGWPGLSVHSIVAPVQAPIRVLGAGHEVKDSEALRSAEQGWLYAPDLYALVLKHRFEDKALGCRVFWQE